MIELTKKDFETIIDSLDMIISYIPQEVTESFVKECLNLRNKIEKQIR